MAIWCFSVGPINTWLVRRWRRLRTIHSWSCRGAHSIRAVNESEIGVRRRQSPCLNCATKRCVSSATEFDWGHLEEPF